MTKTITLKIPKHTSYSSSSNPLLLLLLHFPSNFPIISMSINQEQEEEFSFPVSASSTFIESPRLQWRRVPPTAVSTPLTRLELLRSKYQRRSFSCMENDSAQMMRMMMMRRGTHDQDQDHTIVGEGNDFNKMDLLWEDLHELPKSKKYFNDDEDHDSFYLDQVASEKRRGLGLHGTVAIFKVLKKLLYVRKTGSSRSI